MGGELIIKRTAVGRKKAAKPAWQTICRTLFMLLYPPDAPRSLPRVLGLASLVARISASAIRETITGYARELRFAELYRC